MTKDDKIKKLMDALEGCYNLYIRGAQSKGVAQRKLFEQVGSGGMRWELTVLGDRCPGRCRPRPDTFGRLPTAAGVRF